MTATHRVPSSLARVRWAAHLPHRARARRRYMYQEGCTTTKMMVARAPTYLAGEAADYGVHRGEVAVDMARYELCPRR
jgi:hypothetical protein